MCYLLNSALEEIFQIIDNLDYSDIKSEYKTVNRTSKKTPKKTTDRIIQTAQEEPLGAIQNGTVLGVEPYYVKMVDAWLLATALAKYTEQTRKYIRQSTLPQDIIKLWEH